MLKFYKLGLVGIVSLLATSSTLCRIAWSQRSDVTSSRQWHFGQIDDLNADGWPDDWSRRSGEGFPRYTKIAIARETTNAKDLAEIEQLRRLLSQAAIGWQQKKLPWTITPESAPPWIDAWFEQTVLNPFLQLEMDGGGAEVQSPLIEIDNRFDYGLRCTLRFREIEPNLTTSSQNSSIQGKLEGFNASASIRLFDSQKQLITEERTPPLAVSGEWHSLEALCSLPARSPNDSPVTYAQISLHVQSNSRSSGRAFVDCDAVQLLPHPKLELRQNQPSGIYFQGAPVEIAASVGSFPKTAGTARIQVRDHTGHSILDSNITSESSSNERSWDFHQLQPGYYEVSLQPTFPGASLATKVQSFVILDETLQARNSRFGISEPMDAILDRDFWMQRYSILGANQLKTPVIGPSTESLSAQQLTEHIDALQHAGYKVAGVISPFGKLFSKEEGETLRGVLQVLSARLNRFQFGNDFETQFHQSSVVQARLQELERQLLELNQTNQFVAVLDPIDGWKDSQPVQFYSKDEFTANETRGLLARLGPTNWFSVAPVSRSRYSNDVRIDDLLQRMLLTTAPPVADAPIGWVPSLRDSERGLFTEAGQPTEMLVPFRNISYFLRDAENMGAIEDAGLPPNALLRRGEQATLALWGGEPVEVHMYLGDDIRVRDVWGREVPHTNAVTPRGARQMFVKGPYPVFVEGVDAAAARWRMGMKLLTQSIAIELDRDSMVQVEFSNPELQAIQGSLQLESEIFAFPPAAIPFAVGPNERGTIQVPVRLTPFAESGPQSMAITAKIEQTSAPTYVSIDREINVGSGQISSEVDYYFDGDGNLIVLFDLATTNQSLGKFDCYATAPGRTRKRIQFEATEQASQQKFIFEQGKRLAGQTLWIQAEQLEENLIINRRISIALPQEETP